MSDAGSLLLGATARAIRLIDRFRPALPIGRGAMVMQRGITLGYEDLAGHDELRHDPLLAVLAGNSPGSDCARPGKSSRAAGVESARPLRRRFFQAITIASAICCLMSFCGRHLLAADQLTD